MEKGRPYQECVEFTKIIKPTQTPPTPNFEFVGVLESWFHQNWFENFEWFEIQSKSSHSDDYLKSLFLLKPVRGRLRGFMEMFFLQNIKCMKRNEMSLQIGEAMFLVG